eukprot:c25379_g1_i1 orf=255-782(+)
MSVAAGVSDAAITVREKLRGKIGQTKVKRYWPGKAPEWAEGATEGVEDEGDIKGLQLRKDEEDVEVRRVRVKREELQRAFPSRDESDVYSKDDARLRRLAESRRDREEAVARHRLIRQAEIVTTREEERKAQEGAELEEEDEDAIEERRRRIKEKLLQRQREEEVALGEEEEEEE